MFKVMVVDDEPIVRLAIKSLVNWKDHGFDLELEASNGRQALKLFEEHPDIDIIVTDINMPIMNGLELMSEISRTPLPPSLLILSAYNDYSLVRQAFKLGAKDYILKTNMDSNTLLELLLGAAKELDQKRSHFQADHDPVTIKPELNYLREKLLKDLIEAEDVMDIETKVKDYGLKIEKRNLVTCFLWVDDYQLVAERYDQNTLKAFVSSSYNAINQVLKDISLGEVLSLSPQEYLLILSFEDSSMMKIREKILEILGKIKYSLSNYVNINISVGVSNIKDEFKNIKELYKQAEGNARLRFILGKGKIIFPEDMKLVSKGKIQSIIGKEGHLIFAFKEVNKEKALKELEDILSTIRRLEPVGIERMHTYYMELIFIIIKFLNDIGEDTIDIFGKEIIFYERIKKFETREEIEIWMKKLTILIIEYLSQRKDAKINRTVARAQEFIKDNYKEDISLKMISEYVGLSECHFSNIFAKKTGETLTSYVTNIRVDKAKFLLSNTNMKIYEICEEIGYANVEHFSRVFKKATGSSPIGYKKG